MTNNYSNHLTSMFSLGQSLLEFAIKDLGFEELVEWKNYEQGALNFS